MSKKQEVDLTEVAIAGASHHVSEATHALRKGCSHALIAGLHLIWLHQQTVSMGGDRKSISVPHGTLIGFEEAVKRVGLAKRTAYRWMEAVGHALRRANYINAEEGFMDMPVIGSPRWEMWVEKLVEISSGISLNRLILGADRPGTEMHRLSELTDAVEEGRQRAIELMEAVDAGKYSLAQAMKALGSQEAYDRLPEEGGDKVRRDPVYLDIKLKPGSKTDWVATGLVPKSLTTLRNAFAHWEELPVQARRKVRDLWLDVVAELPADLMER